MLSAALLSPLGATKIYLYSKSADIESPRLSAKLAAYNDQRIESLRPGVFVRLYVRSDLWPAFLECQAEKAVASP